MGEDRTLAPKFHGPQRVCQGHGLRHRWKSGFGVVRFRMGDHLVGMMIKATDLLGAGLSKGVRRVIDIGLPKRSAGKRTGSCRDPGIRVPTS